GGGVVGGRRPGGSGLRHRADDVAGGRIVDLNRRPSAGVDPRAVDVARLAEQLRIGQQRTSRSLRSHFAIVARATRAGTTTTRTAPEPRRHEEIRRTRRNVCVRFSTKVFFVDLRVFVSSWFRLSSCLRGSGSLRVL